jgi:hypothetical protein
VKKEIIISALALFLIVTPAFAKQGSSSENSPKNNQKNNQNHKEEECSPEGKYKNHGEYVSCIAREHRGGEEVSDGAKSDIGKKHEDDKEKHPTSPATSPATSVPGSIHSGFNPFKSFEDNLHRFFSSLHFK